MRVDAATARGRAMTALRDQDVVGVATALAETRYGDVHYYAFDNPIGEALRRYGEWAGAEVAFLRRLLRPGDTVVDGGANVGAHALAFADRVGPTGCVHAVEASPDVLPLLRGTVASNPAAPIRIVAAALGAGEGSARIGTLRFDGLENVGALAVLPPGADTRGARRVAATTIDALALAAVRLVKLDIEGQELAAIRGAAATIERCRPFVSVEVNDLDRAVPVLLHMRAAGYAAWFCTFPAFSPRNYRGEQDNMFGHAREALLLFAPSETAPDAGDDGGEATPVATIDDLATLFAAMPRYGDETDHDRDPVRLKAEMAMLRALPDTTPRIETARRQDDEATADALAALVERRVLDRFGDVAAAVRSVAELESAVSAHATLHRDADRRGRDAAARLDAAAASLTAVSTVVDDYGATLREFVGDRSHRAAAALAQAKINERWERVLVDLKVEQGTLREALLGRAEDRSQVTLRIEQLQIALAECTGAMETLRERLAEGDGRTAALAVRMADAERHHAALTDRADRVLAGIARAADRPGIAGRIVRWLTDA